MSRILPFLLVLTLFVAGCKRAAMPPPKIGIWYWHTPFSVSGPELGWIKKAGISTLYVRAATFTTDGVHVKTMIPQRWAGNADGMPVVLAFNFDNGLRSHFRALANPAIAADVIAGIVRHRDAALKRKINVTGVQMDVDCPTSLLPKYAELLGMIKAGLISSKALNPGDTFSSTALQTWLTSRDYGKLADACDFVVPQFYEGRTGKTVDTVQPISDVANLPRGMDRAERSGKPFYVGLGIYGHALLYDERGELAGMYHGMQPEDALRHPSLTPETTTPLMDGATPTGENLLVLRADHPDLNGRGKGYRIAYVLPSPEMLARELKSFSESRTSQCQGFILYRFPEATDELSLPLPTIAQALSGKAPKLKIETKISSRAVPWPLIGTGKVAKRSPYEYVISATSVGSAPTLASPDAFSMVVQFNHPGLEECETGDFDAAQTGKLNTDGTLTPCAPAHADAILFRRFHILPGARIRSGAIQVGADGPIPIKVSWVARGGSGSVSGSTQNLSSIKQD